MPGSIVVIPTYNEARNLPILVAELWALQIPGLAVLVVDDNSPDGTGDIADELAGERPDEFFVIHQEAKGGLRQAYIAGFNQALNSDADHIIQMDCDFSHSPSHIPEMLESIVERDLVIGSRYVTGGKLDERTGASRYLLRYWTDVVYNRLVLKLSVLDATSGFKCWRADALRRIDLETIVSDGYAFQIEMSYVAEKLGFRVAEIPILYEDRRSGREKLRILNRFAAVIRAWQLLWRYRDIDDQLPQPETTVGEKELLERQARQRKK